MLRFCGLCLVSIFVWEPLLAEIPPIDRLEGVDQTPTVRVDHFVDRRIESVGRVIDSYRQASYLTTNDRIYISTTRPVSAGDRLTIIRDEGRVATHGIFVKSSARRYSIRGFARVTRVYTDAVEARIYDAQEAVEKGDLLVPYRSNMHRVQTREPQEDIRGKILAGAQDTGIIGAYEMAFLDQGAKAGLQLNDRLTVYRQATESGRASSSVEIPVATLVIVNLSDDFATAYTLASSEAFEPGARFKTSIPEIRFLD